MKKNICALGIVALFFTIGIGVFVVSKGKPSSKVTPSSEAKHLEHSASNNRAEMLNHNSQLVAMPKQLETPRAAKTELPASIQNYLAQPKVLPKMAGLPLVDATGEELLIQKYREIGAITNKAGLIRLMAYTGSDRIFELFASTLTNELSGRTISGAEAAIVVFMPELIGILARNCDPAFEFLKAGLQPGFWKQNATWKTPAGPDQPRILVGGCIKGLALSGRNDGKEIIHGFRTQRANSYVRAIDSSVVGSAFILDYINEYGLEGYLDNITIRDLDSQMKAYVAWTKTSNGVAWRAWRQRVDRSR
jgi:hypothetical protein